MKKQELKLEDSIEGEIESAWDPKKIIIGVVILSVLGLLGSIMLTGSSRQDSTNGPSALGVTSDDFEKLDDSEVPQLPDRSDVDRIIRETRETISNLTAENLTSSDAAIQKVISDLSKLREGKGAGDVLCDLVCKK